MLCVFKSCDSSQRPLSFRSICIPVTKGDEMLCEQVILPHSLSIYIYMDTYWNEIQRKINVVIDTVQKDEVIWEQYIARISVMT